MTYEIIKAGKLPAGLSRRAKPVAAERPVREGMLSTKELRKLPKGTHIIIHREYMISEFRHEQYEYLGLTRTRTFGGRMVKEKKIRLIKYRELRLDYISTSFLCDVCAEPHDNGMWAQDVWVSKVPPPQ